MSPTDIPNTPTAQPVPSLDVIDESTVKTARRLERAKTLVKNTFTKVGVPVLIGSAAALVVTRQTCRQDEEDFESDDTDPDE